MTGITIATQIPSAYSCNSSPTFSSVPQYFLNAQFPFAIDLSATDADGDSLVYELCSPLIGGGPNTNNFDAPFGVAPNPDTNLPYDTVRFAIGFDSQQPFPSEPQLAINDTTGILTGNVTVLGNFIIAVCVKEFRDGNLIGITRRQFQISVSNEVVSTKTELWENTVTLFPNPSKGYINISFSDDLIINSYGIIDIEGQILEQKDSRDYSIQVKNLPDGLYFVVLNTSNGRIMKKLVKQ
ncbi:MAG: T9SS type A sorting domain-containing protein [Bacteroidota bacterium]